MKHIGWRNVTTGQLWVVAAGHKPAEYDVGPEWEPIYTRDWQRAYSLAPPAAAPQPGEPSES